MASGDYIIPGASSVSEWYSPIQGFIQGCGQAAELVIAGIASGKPPSTSEVTQAIQQGIAAGKAGAHGSTTPTDIKWLAQQQGINLNIGSGTNAISTIESNLANGLPTEIGVGNARAFGGSDSNVLGHYVTVVGKAANGSYIVADPNTKAATQGGFVQYTAQQIKNANPFATLTPTSLPGGLGGAIGPAGNANSAVGGAALGGLFQALGVTPQDFTWRAGLIVGGFVLIVVGILVFFSHEAETVVTTGAKAAGKAASA